MLHEVLADAYKLCMNYSCLASVCCLQSLYSRGRRTAKSMWFCMRRARRLVKVLATGLRVTEAACSDRKVFRACDKQLSLFFANLLRQLCMTVNYGHDRFCKLCQLQVNDPSETPITPAPSGCDNNVFLSIEHRLGLFCRTEALLMLT